MPSTPKGKPPGGGAAPSSYESPPASNAKSKRRLSSMFSAGMSLLKSLGGKSAAKRKRDDDDDDDADADASDRGDGSPKSSSEKRRRRASDPDADGPPGVGGFITSSVRKTKSKSAAKGAVGGAEAGGPGAASDPTPRDLGKTFQSVDEDVAVTRHDRSTGKPSGGAGGSKTKRRGAMSSIFSPMFSFFGGGKKSEKSAAAAAGRKAKAKRAADAKKEKDAAQLAAKKKKHSTAAASARTRAPRGATGTAATATATTKYGATAAAVETAAARQAKLAAEERAAANAPPAAKAADSGSGSDVTEAAAATGPGPGQSAPATSTPPTPTVADAVLRDGFGALQEDEYEYEENDPELDDEYDEEFDPWVFIHGLPPLKSCVPAKRAAILPKKSKAEPKNTLVLDLDETLVHSNLEATEDACDFSFPVTFNNQQHIVNVRKRPYLREFMEFAAARFEVVVFTASQRVYAERLLNTIDPEKRLIKHRLYRESCVLVEGNYMKDLSVLGRDLSRTIIVDNSPQAFGFQVDNGVPIESWFDDVSDRQLLKLMPLLARLSEVSDVRPLLRGKFNLGDRIERAGERVAALQTMAIM